MTDDRSEMEANREAGLRQRHEQRLARVPERNWKQTDPETGEPVHLRMGLTADGQGPADPPDPQFDHWGCWCPDPECPGPPEPVTDRGAGHGQEGA